MSRSAPETHASATALARLRAGVLGWYGVERRDFPWRQTSDPWAVLVSEVMLQQTQAARVVDRFPPFLRRFPTPAAMAAAGDADVLAAWSGLGYNRRALALRMAAQEVVRAGWPDDVAGLMRLPGVGRYTARAVAALAFGRPVGAVDTNVRRWLVRRFGLTADVRPAELQALADGLAAPARSADEAAAWMHASMEFGARVCASRAPRCDACPVARGCPSRGTARHVAVPRQAAFAGSDRARRGALLRALATAPDHALPLTAARELVDGPDFDRVADGLERDGLAHRLRGSLRLGGGEPPGPVATIGP